MHRLFGGRPHSPLPTPAWLPPTKQMLESKADSGGAGPSYRQVALPVSSCRTLHSAPPCRTREEAKRKAVVLAPAIAKWLKQCGAADAAVGGISWRKVLQPGKKVSCRCRVVVSGRAGRCGCIGPSAGARCCSPARR